MKDFLKYVFGTVVGILLFTLLACIIVIMNLVGMVASNNATKNVEENSVLTISLSGTLNDQGSSDIIGAITGNTYHQIGLNNTLEAIKKAKENEDVKGIYMECGPLATSYASAGELRKAIQDFRKSGKWVVAYGETFTQQCYYIASAANKVYLNPQGMLDWHGIGSETLYLKDLLAKVGIRMEVFKVGKYKSYTEMFTEDAMTAPNRAQTQRYITGIWNNICKEVSTSRNIPVQKLNEYADSYIALSDPKTLVTKKFIDGLLYNNEVKNVVKKLLKQKSDEPITQISVADMMNVKSNDEGEAIAVYYAEGSIVDSPMTGNIMGGGQYIVGSQVCKDLEDLMNDDDIKAVVIRINSGGGSAYASEQMLHQIDLLRKKKPVVVSMGGMAASGGYYMACHANHIVAQPNTLTGSIGIFGVIPDRSELLTKKLGIKFDEVKTNRNATFGTSARSMNEEEKALMQAYIVRGYTLFRNRVATGRHMTEAQVEALAQGHVYTGEDALKLKLVDQLGGINDAVKVAAKLAKLQTYYTEEYPTPPSFMDSLLGSVTEGNNLDEQLRSTLGIYYEPYILLKQVNTLSPVQARIPYFVNIK